MKKITKKVTIILLVVVTAILAGIGMCVYEEIHELAGGIIMTAACIAILPIIELALPKGRSLFRT